MREVARAPRRSCTERRRRPPGASRLIASSMFFSPDSAKLVERDLDLARGGTSGPSRATCCEVLLRLRVLLAALVREPRVVDGLGERACRPAPSRRRGTSCAVELHSRLGPVLRLVVLGHGLQAGLELVAAASTDRVALAVRHPSCPVGSFGPCAWYRPAPDAPPRARAAAIAANM